MNIKKWIEDNAFVEDHGWGDLCITVEAIQELLKTHAIVPREPNDSMVIAIVYKTYTRKGTASSRAVDSHKAMIKVVENV